uniref:Ribonuclease n=1 Tax=Meloidogyne incognita TaxID=6306 RepID=A0A914KJE8_MELIC
MEKEAFLDFEAIDADNFSNFNTGAPCILGIDEAGRGPVLGPMVYGCAIVPADKMEDLKSLGVNDSKILSRSQREKVITKMEASEFVTYSLRIVHPRTISAQMQRRTRLSLNEISHNCIIGLIQHALKRICIQEIFVDLVGVKEETFLHFLQSHFPSLKITVSKKADSIFPIVGAASIFAKVTRDRRVSNWILDGFTSPKEGIGSGYPSDPMTKCYISRTLDSLFGFSPLVRFSWRTIEKLLGNKAVKCFWNVQGTDDDPLKQRTLKEIWASNGADGKDKHEQHLKHKKGLVRHRFFAERGIANIDIIV